MSDDEMMRMLKESWLDGLASGMSSAAGMSGAPKDVAMAFGKARAEEIEADPAAMLMVEQSITNRLNGVQADLEITVKANHKGRGES